MRGKSAIIALTAAMLALSSCSMQLNGATDSESGENSAATPQITQITQSPTPPPTAAPTPSPSIAAVTDYESIDNKGTGWGFVRKKGAPPEITAKQKSDLKDYGGVYLDEENEAALYLTFDEGYENGYTAQILDVLAEKKVPAAFFVTGQYLESQTELIQRMIDEGHIVGNHTAKHLNLPKQSTETVKAELDRLNEKCKELYGVEMKYMRPPEGEYSPRVLAIAKDMGYLTVFWSMAYKDWDANAQNGKQYAYDSVVPYIHGGAIILLHAVSSDNANALSEIIDAAREMGYEFKSLDDMNI